MVWSGERGLRFDAGINASPAPGGPPPAHPIGIWLGVYGALALVAGRVADGCARTGRRCPHRDMARRLDDAIAAAGRGPTCAGC